jgi:hypothetical protein
MSLGPCGHTPFSAPPDDLPESPAKRRALRAPGSLPRRSAAGPEAAPPSRSRPNLRGAVPPKRRACASRRHAIPVRGRASDGLALFPGRRPRPLPAPHRAGRPSIAPRLGHAALGVELQDVAHIPPPGATTPPGAGDARSPPGQPRRRARPAAPHPPGAATRRMPGLPPDGRRTRRPQGPRHRPRGLPAAPLRSWARGRAALPLPSQPPGGPSRSSAAPARRAPLARQRQHQHHPPRL